MKRTLKIMGIFLVAITLSIALCWGFRIPLVENGLNRALKDYFAGTLTLEAVQIHPNGALALVGIRGRYQTREGGIPLQIRSLTSREPIAALLAGRTVTFIVEGLRAGTAPEENIKGEARVKIGSDWHFELKAQILNLELRDLTPLSPENLAGSSGILKGTLTLRTDAREDTVFGLVMNVFEPGGSLQSRFFDLLLPYLPQIQAQTKVQSLAASGKTVPYRNAHLNVGLEDPQQMKLFFHILVPDYNLDLNIHMMIRVDHKNAFFELAQLLGLAQLKAA